MSYRLGVDVGGTFTDLALYDTDTDRLEFAKTPSTPVNQALGVATGIRELMESARRFSGPDRFLHTRHDSSYEHAPRAKWCEDSAGRYRGIP